MTQQPPKPLSPKQLATAKFSKVCSHDAYLRLHNWHYTVRNKRLMDDDKVGCIVPVTTGYYRNTSHRMYYSNWLESVIWRFFAHYLERNDVNIPYDKGQIIKTKSNREIFIKTKNAQKGKADVIINMVLASGQGSMIINLEVKANKDVMSAAQKTEQESVRRKGQIYEIVRTLDDFWRLVDSWPLVYYRGLSWGV